MKNKITTIALFLSLFILTGLIFSCMNDTGMKMKHWFLISLFTANLQILIEKYFRE